MLVVIVVDITIYDLKYYCYKTNKQTNKPRKYRKKIKITNNNLNEWKTNKTRELCYKLSSFLFYIWFFRSFHFFETKTSNSSRDKLADNVVNDYSDDDDGDNDNDSDEHHHLRLEEGYLFIV